MSSLVSLESKIGYVFVDKALLTRAVTHRSFASKNNERLEFLGDSVLGQIVAEYLFLSFEEATEGQLSRARASIVKEPTLARIARKLHLGNYLKLGGGELKSGGFNRDSILADALEAVLGAVYLDSGFEKAKEFVNTHFSEEFANANPGSLQKDPKTRLQEFLQQNGLDLPLYEVTGISGASHEQQFTVLCTIPSHDISLVGTGSSKRKAEQSSASLALDSISKTPGTNG